VSTFGGISTAFSGLQAARQGLDVTGQNIANARTPGYTRQRVEQSAIPATADRFSSAPRAGQGVSVDGIARLANATLDAQVRSASARAGYQNALATAWSRIETSLREPGADGLSAALETMWGSWQAVANRPGDAATAAVLIGDTTAVADRLNELRAGVDAQWAQTTASLQVTVASANGDAARVAELNGAIRRAQLQGSDANELRDQRDALVTDLAASLGATARANDDGTVDVLVDGDALVLGADARRLEVSAGAALGSPVAVTWADGGAPAVLGGAAGGMRALVAPDGVLAGVQAGYLDFAAGLADAVNTLHRGGVRPDGAAGGDVFAIAADGTVSAVPTGVADLALRPSAASGALDARVADAIAQLSPAIGGAWSSLVGRLGQQSRAETSRADATAAAQSNAVAAQQSEAGVDIDEETVNLLGYQHAYAAAARVLTTVDEMLDTLINRTGVVGR